MDEEDDDREFTTDDKAKFLDWKNKFSEHVIHAIKAGIQVK